MPHGRYRARLTSKPWRCGCEKPPTRWPFLDADHEARFDEWETLYHQASEGDATCELITTQGNPEWHPALQPLIGLHDAATHAPSKLPLA